MPHWCIAILLEVPNVATKPNPDAPCPCGSGKLYRDCCGKDNK
jgi:uncharacterized protein YchJ